MKRITVFILILASITAQAQRKSVATEQDVYGHIEYLADDRLEGRRTGSQGEEIAAKYIADEFRKANLFPKGNNGFYQNLKLKHSTNPHAHAHDNTSKFEEINAQNVIGFLNNNAPYTMVIGAHYDHLGLGHDGNSLEANSKGQIHNGADDNASGVAGVIELAKALSGNKIKENYNFLFMAFTGEELGLLGSKKFCDNATIDMSTVNCMINMDMIGRLKDSTKRLMISGIGTSDKWKSCIANANTYFSIKYDSSGTGPSDHTSFYNHDIPVLHFFSGQHSDYHKPSDDIEKINLEGTTKIIDLIYGIIMQVNELPRLDFYKTKSKEGKKMSFKVTLGIMPDYTAEVKGLRIDGVNKDRPAERAGMSRGDIITQMGDIKIDDIYAYMKALSKFKKGQTITIKVLRDKKEISLPLTF